MSAERRPKVERFPVQERVGDIAAAAAAAAVVGIGVVMIAVVEAEGEHHFSSFILSDTSVIFAVDW